MPTSASRARARAPGAQGPSQRGRRPRVRLRVASPRGVHRHDSAPLPGEADTRRRTHAFRIAPIRLTPMYAPERTQTIGPERGISKAPIAPRISMPRNLSGTGPAIPAHRDVRMASPTSHGAAPPLEPPNLCAPSAEQLPWEHDDASAHQPDPPRVSKAPSAPCGTGPAPSFAATAITCVSCLSSQARHKLLSPFRGTSTGGMVLRHPPTQCW